MHLAELRQRRANGISYADLGYFSVAVPYLYAAQVFQSRLDVFLPTTITDTLHQLQLSLIDDLGSIELTTLKGSCMMKVARPACLLPLTADEFAVQQAAIGPNATLAQISAGWRLTQDLARRAEAQNVADLVRQDALLDLAFAALDAL